MKRTLLIDADVTAYQAASAVEEALEIEPDYWVWSCDFKRVKARIEENIAFFMQELKADDYILCLTDSAGNFRREVYPGYKGNRVKVKRPLALKPAKEWMIEELNAYFRPRLEGDDILGILATHPHLVPGEKVIVSLDKDMKTVPGLYYRNPDDGLVLITEAEAERYFFNQVLTGDVTDGYPGCPGVGPKKAEKILGDLGGAEAWQAIVAAYEKAGLTEADALTQARCARILHASDYDFKRKEPKLWNPPK
ncbi:hypothetical protein [Martelella mangrovi]|uniref:DNA polymerase-1 n=1 Tax=Martelella mangrovi TaxID=1397477 RepID=A0ABV2IE04_9HYPH